MRSLHKNLSDLSLIARGGEMFYSETLVFSRRPISELMIPALGRPISCSGVRFIGFEG